MPESAFRPTDVDPHAFVAAVPHPVRRSDAGILLDLMGAVTGQPPAMWGPNIVGFGQYHYRYASGREGDSLAVGFSPRQSSLVLYGLQYGEGSDLLLAHLGKHKTGSSCIYVNKLADVDHDILARLIRGGYEYSTTARQGT